MQSYITCCEEIQKKIQSLHDRGEREQKLFDTISSEHPELSAKEVVAYVQSKVDETEPKSINFNGHCVSVGDYVETINDPELLARAERGHFIHSATKEIYLGEKGKVIRIWNSFQGKPALELLFADNAEKMFFLDCIDLGDKENRKEATSAKLTQKASLPKEKQSVAAAAPPPPPPRVSSAPQWNDIIQLKSTLLKVTETKPEEVAFSSDQEHPVSSVNTHFVGKVGNHPTDKQASTADPPAAATISQKKVATSLKSPTVTFQSIGLVKEAFSDQLGHVITSGKEELGRPLYSANNPKIVNVSHEIDNLAKTPRPDFLKVSPPANGECAPHHPEFVSRVPLCCPPDYCPKFSIDDSDTHIPQYKSATDIKIKKCWIAGYDPEKPGNLRFFEMTIRTNIDTLETVLARATKEIGEKIIAKRLFYESGAEIMRADAILDNSRLVATTGVNFDPSLLEQPDSQIVTKQASDAKSRTRSPRIKTGKVQPQHEAPVPKAREEQCSTPSGRQPNTPRNKTLGTTNCGPFAPSVSPKPSHAGPLKLIHIHVYENGSYESNEYERAYRTVTIRPTYRTLDSVKTIITRELGWKRGMKADILFDVSGAEITLMDQLYDGASVIASAGDRFIVPYPNSSLHKECLEFSRKAFNK